MNKAKLLRQKLREQKAQKDKEEGKDQESNPTEAKVGFHDEIVFQVVPGCDGAFLDALG